MTASEITERAMLYSGRFYSANGRRPLFVPLTDHQWNALIHENRYQMIDDPTVIGRREFCGMIVVESEAVAATMERGFDLMKQSGWSLHPR